jgi:SAM-dependent methyltransferase
VAAAAAAAGTAADSPVIAAPTVSVASRGTIRTLHLCDSCPEALQRTRDYWAAHSSSIPAGREHVYHELDEEGSLPFAPASVDLIVSNLDMHWINDLPGFLKRCKQALKPDGVFLASMLGGATLQELRSRWRRDRRRAKGQQCGEAQAAWAMLILTLSLSPSLSLVSDHRSALTVADMERLGGIHAHVSPFAYGRDCGDLLASAGFTMPTGQQRQTR